MVRKKIRINDQLGLHLRPASDLSGRAVEFESNIMIHFRDREFNAKSVLGVLSACVRQGDEIEIVCKGPDEEEALKSLSELLGAGE